MKRLLSFVVVALFAAINMQAKHISSTEALQLAFSKTSNNGAKAKTLNSYVLTYTADELYAYNTADGFVILAADDCMPDMVLGYSDHGTFDYVSMPDAMKEWLSEMNDEIAQLAAIQSKYPNRVSYSLEVLDPIAPLTKSQWNQSAPYNNMAPTNSSGSHYAAGCVPVAMAQVMYYHKWPEHGTGSNSYSWEADGTQTLSMDFSQSVYDWTNMCDSYGSTSTEVQENAVAKLLLDCGVAVSANYTSSNTNANIEDAIKAYITNFSYDKSLSCVKRAYYTKREWRDLLYNNLAQNMPIYYRGMSNTGGHAFVCDGYKDGLFHINWGWGGQSDGYFQIAILEPAEQGIGGSTSGYQFDQMGILSIKPDCGSDVACIIYCESDFKTSTKTTTTSSSVYFSGNFKNESCSTVDVNFGVKIVDAKGNVQYVASSNLKNKNIQRGISLMNMNIPMSGATLSEGTYTITPVYQQVGADSWSDMPVLKTTSIQYVVATVDADGNVSLSTPSTAATLNVDSIAPQTSMLAGYDTDVDYQVQCTKGDYLGNVYVAILESGTTTVVSKSVKGYVDLAEGEGYTYNNTVTNPTVAGTYDLVLLDESGNIISNRVEVTVEDAPSSTLAISGKLTAKSKAINDLQINLNLQCTGGVFNNKLRIYIYDSSSNLLLTLSNTSRTFLVEGESVDVLFTSNSTGLTKGKKCFAHAYYLDSTWKEICSTMFVAAAATGIEDISQASQDDLSPAYNLQGQKIDKHAKGIVIQNGRKYVNM